MEIISLVGRYLSDIFFELPDEPIVHDVHIVDLTDSYRSVFGSETLPRLLVAGPYDDPFAAKLRAFKYSGDRTSLDGFARMAGALLAGEEFDLIAVPPAPIARRIMRFGRVPMREILLRAGYSSRLATGIYSRDHYRRAQARHDRDARLRLFRDDPFFVRSPSPIYGKRIVIADDVLSTGATAHALARALRRAGATVAAGVFLASGAYPPRQEDIPRV